MGWSGRTRPRTAPRLLLDVFFKTKRELAPHSGRSGFVRLPEEIGNELMGLVHPLESCVGQHSPREPDFTPDSSVRQR